jgi:hypothetical protein
MAKAALPSYYPQQSEGTTMYILRNNVYLTYERLALSGVPCFHIAYIAYYLVHCL